MTPCGILSDMATTKKSTKAKTKTTRAKAAPKKATTKTAAKTSNKKTTSKAAVKAEVVKQPKAQKKNILASIALNKIYMASVAVYVLIAGAAAYFMSSASYQISLGYLAKDELASVKETVFAPAFQGIYDVEIRWVVIAVAVLSLVMPLLYLTRLRAYNREAIKRKVMATRWIEMAVVGALMLETVALLSGVTDIGTLKLVGGLMMVTCVLGWMAEKRTAEAGRPATAKYLLSMVTGLLPWVIIALYAICTPVYGGVRYTWFVYALYAVMLIGGGIMGTVQRKALVGQGSFKDYENAEKGYSLTSLLIRTAFSVVLIVGLMAK